MSGIAFQGCNLKLAYSDCAKHNPPEWSGFDLPQRNLTWGAHNSICRPPKKRGEPLFFSLYDHDFIRAAVCMPEVRVADPAFNVAQTIDLLQSAVRKKAWLEQLNRIPSADP
jgi:hypothetical protein